jgi:hypothetical protein
MADGGGLDDLDSGALDEDFVRGATIHELDHKTREQAARGPRRRRREARRQRPSRLRRFVRQPSWTDVASMTFFLSLSAVLIEGAVGVGPASFIAGSVGLGDDADEPSSAEAADEIAASDDEPVAAAITTTTLHDLEGGSFRTGACIIWSDEVRVDSDAPVKNVPCTQPHFLEITGRSELPGAMNYPESPATWGVLDAERCESHTQKYLGGPLLSTGRFYTSDLHPTRGGWRAGDRTLVCGIAVHADYGATPDPSGEQNVPFTGAVKGQSEERVPPVGTCFVDVGPDRTDDTSCTNVHQTEVAGHIGLAGRIDHAPTEADVDGSLSKDCRGVASSYLGRPLRRNESEGWMRISGEEWAAGWRTLTCTVGRSDGKGGWAPITESLGRQ